MKNISGIRTPKAVQALAPVNYFFALFANALCVATHIKQNVAAEEEHFCWLLDVEPFPWPRLLEPHFVCRAGEPHTVEMRTSEHERTDCVEAIREYFSGFSEHDNSEFSRHLENVDLCLNALQRVIDKGTPSGNRFATIIEKASRVLDPPVRSNSKKVRDARLLGADEIIQSLLIELIGETNLPGYLLSKLHLFVLRLSSPISISELYFDTNFGPYYVVRKARSGITDAPRDRNLLVRDLMWIRPLVGQLDARGYRSDNPAQPTIALGFYISAMDQQVFEITSIAVRNGLMMIDAVAYLDGTDTKSICVYLPEMPLEAKLRTDFASIVGTLRNQRRTGAWSALATRPDLSQEEILRLHFALIFFADAFSLKNFVDKTINYDPLIGEVHSTFSMSQHCGVIYSQDWEERARASTSGEFNGVTYEELSRRIRAFEDCFEYSSKHLKTLEKVVDGLLDELTVSQDDKQTFSRDNVREMLIHLYKRAEQTAINPSSVKNKKEVFHYFANPMNTPALPYLRK